MKIILEITPQELMQFSAKQPPVPDITPSAEKIDKWVLDALNSFAEKGGKHFGSDSV